MQYGLINTQTNLCVNVIELEDPSDWTPPEAHIIEPLVTNAGIGWTFNGEWIEPPQPEATEE